MLLRLTIVLFITCLFNEVYAQTCTQRLEEAMRAYYGGNLREVETLIEYSACAENLTTEQRVNALRIIVISNLFLKEQEKAEDATLQLLKVNPEYKLTDADPPEFENLINAYNREPLFSLGLIAGLNSTFYKVTEQYSTGQLLTVPEYKSNVGFQFGLSGYYHISPKLWVGSGIFFTKKSFSINEINTPYLLSPAYNISSTEKQTYLSLPINIRYVLGGWHSTIRPYVEAGATINYLLSANSQYELSEVESNKPPFVKFDNNVLDQRNRLIYTVYVGTGIIKKIERNIIGLHFGYSLSLTEEVKNNTRFQNPELFQTFGYVDDTFKSNVLTISITYLRTYYRPKLRGK